MKLNFNKTKFNLKIFQIDQSYYELTGKSNDEIIDIIKHNHIKKLSHYDEYSELTKPMISKSEDSQFTFWSYCFNQPKEKSYWKVFLPEELTQNQIFDIIEFSYVLFLEYNEKIYCVISGSGMNVIKKYIRTGFGIDVYQRIAKPTEDVVIELKARGVANNVSQLNQVFTYNQTILETLEYSHIPTNIKLKVRDELKENEFKKYELDEDMAIMEVGSYFLLRKRLDFKELKELIIDIDNLLENNTPKPLTLFSKVIDQDKIESLENHLKEMLVDDILSHFNPQEKKVHNHGVIEIIHPSKLERFFECDNFLIRFKYSRGKDDINVANRTELHYECTKMIYNSLENVNNRFDAKGKLFTLNISGEIEGKQVTYGTFFDHVIAETELLGHKYFKIDGNWYLLEDDYLEFINNDAVKYYSKYILDKDIIKPWADDITEEVYNNSYFNDSQTFVLDRITPNNIELCDILKIHENRAYFIHVKEGFDTSMRDLYVQVVLAAKRLANDLKNNEDSYYLKSALKAYQKKYPKQYIDIDTIVKNIRNGRLIVNFVMAFKNNSYKHLPVLDRIKQSKSNIAKYCMIQTVKEVQQYGYQINLIDISEIK